MDLNCVRRINLKAANLDEEPVTEVRYYIGRNGFVEKKA